MSPPTPAPAAMSQPTPAPAESTTLGPGFVDDNEKGIAAVAYILTWLTGLIIFFVAKKDQKYARWNAVQAIGLGVVAVALLILLNVIEALAFAGGGLATFGVMWLLSMVIWLGLIVLIVIAAVKAYQGTPLRFPVIGDMADKYA